MKIITIILLLSSSLFAQETIGRIFGRIIDFHSRQPLEGVAVFLDKNSQGVMTDQSGYFEFDSLRTGYHYFRLFYIDYPLDKYEFTLTQKCPNKEFEILYEMTDGLIKTGLVDTIYYQNFRGFVRDKYYNSFGKKVTGVNRFIPEINQIIEAELRLIPQYSRAHYRWYKLKAQHEKLSEFELDEWGTKTSEQIDIEDFRLFNEDIITEYEKYNREYLGIICENGRRIIRVHFYSINLEFYEVGGEGHIKRLPLMDYEINTQKWYVAGYTCK